MLTKIGSYNNIRAFLKNTSYFFGAIDNKVVDLDKNVTVAAFGNKVDYIYSNGQDIYATDWDGVSTKLNNKSIQLKLSVDFVFQDGNYISHLSSPKRTALVNRDGRILWELAFRSLEFVFDEELVYLRDGRESENNKVVAVSLKTGKDRWNKPLKELGGGQEFGKFIGVNDNELLLVTRNNEILVFIDKHCGDKTTRIDNSILPSGVSLENFQLELKNNKLVNPNGEIDLSTKLYTSYDIEPQNSIENEDIDIPEVYPFTFNDNYVFLGVQKHINHKADNYKVLGEICVLDRKKHKIIYSELINEKRKEAGIKQIEINENKLYLLDNFNELKVYQVL